MGGLALRRTGGITGEGVGHLVEPPGNEPQLKPSQWSGCLARACERIMIVTIFPAVNQRRAIGVHTQVACTPGDRRLHRRLKGRQLGVQGR
jgi:hypothetical protein